MGVLANRPTQVEFLLSGVGLCGGYRRLGQEFGSFSALHMFGIQGLGGVRMAYI